MADTEHIQILQAGVEVWNIWRLNNPDIVPDLRDTDFSNANLEGVDLRGARLNSIRLPGANLTNSKLGKADLTEANLKWARLWNADLVGANLKCADMKFANFSEADLSEACLENGKLHFAVFSETILEKTRFRHAAWGRNMIGDIDFSTALDLESCYHFDSSSIDHLTLKRSDPLPELFLQGMGLTNWEIEQSRLYQQGLSNAEINKIIYSVYDFRATQSVQISPMFISYSQKDGAFVDRLGGLLTQKGIRYWRDVHHLKAGRLEKQVDRAIRLNDLVLIVLSRHSVKSDWVEHEVRKARAIEKEAGRDIMVPVSLDNSWKSCAWPERLREQIMEYNVTDFSQWQDEKKLWRRFSELLYGIDLFYK